MKSIQIIILLITIGITLTNCASKKFAKQANKYAQAGLYKDAAEMYYKSVAANNNNIDAKMGLQRSGQLLLQEKIDAFKTNYDNNAIKEAVYSFIDADSYYNKVKMVGVALIFPEEHRVYYNEVKEKYLGKRYESAMQALDIEDFASSEQVFNEILSIDPTYKDSKANWTIAKFEPLYRQGINEFNSKRFRTSYYSFDNILKGTGVYKESNIYKNKSLENALITIAIAPFYTSTYQNNYISSTLNKQILKNLNQIQSPFYKAVADPVIALLPTNGKRSRLHDLIPFINANKKKIKAKAILTGSIIRFNTEQGSLISTTKKGYIKRTFAYIDKTSGEKKNKTIYDKTTYKELRQNSKSTIEFEYSIIEVSTGMIILSDIFNITKNDDIHYATFDGNIKDLVPGNWKYSDKNSPIDIINDNNNAVKELNQLFSANKQIKPAQNLTSEIIDEISQNIMASLIKYNPEQ
ncbi:MAG: hypothetical protein JW717_06170 [Marinilabiliaceae bacterium]|nr:hypothetical protein [Marinilabiliaceae bacterium]